MARLVKPLSDLQIKNAKPKEQEYNLPDGQGLSLRVKPNGTKQWLFNYEKPFTSKRTNISFGVYPDVTLEQARSKRLDARSLLAQNVDPKEHRDSAISEMEKAHALSLEKVALDWFEVKKSKVTPNYAEDLWRSLEVHIFPSLGQTPIHLLTAPKAIKVISPIAAKGNLETVKRLCQRINEIMVYALNVGFVGTNPLAGIHHHFRKPVKKNMPALTPQELPEFLHALNIASIKRMTRCLIEWQLHTITRPSEAAGARWCEIDMENALWTIPAERMKRRKPHAIPLSPQALSILEILQPMSGHREFLFTSLTDYSKPMSEQTANMAIRRMGFGGRLVAHGLRSIASTTLNEQGFDPDVIEAALSHGDKNQVRSAYNRAQYLEKRKIMMSWWSDHIDAASSGPSGLANRSKHLRLVAQA